MVLNMKKRCLDFLKLQCCFCLAGLIFLTILFVVDLILGFIWFGLVQVKRGQEGIGVNHFRCCLC